MEQSLFETWGTETTPTNNEDAHLASDDQSLASSTQEDAGDIDFNQVFSMQQTNAVQSGGYTILKPGTYPAQIIGIKRAIHTPKPGGKIPRCGKVEVTFQVTSEESTVECRKTYYLINDRNALSQMFFLYKATGLLNADGTFGSRWDEMTGKQVDVTVADTTNQATGKTYHNQITRVMPPAITAEDLPF